MSLVGHRAQNHPQQVDANGARDDVDDRRTPLDLLDECRRLAGVPTFDLDVAANAENAKAPYYINATDDGLVKPWRGRVWCNPPYSNIRQWVDKAWAEWCEGRVEVIAMLLPANRTEQAWWQLCVEPYRTGPLLRVHFLSGRRRFDRPGWTKPAKGDRPPFGLCLLVWGSESLYDNPTNLSAAAPRPTTWNDPVEGHRAGNAEDCPVCATGIPSAYPWVCDGGTP